MIASFERLHRLTVTVHDVGGILAAGLAPTRRGHMHALCRAVKASGGQADCSAFDVTRLRGEAPHLAEGRVHVCPAGLVEWVVPILQTGILRFVLFAGPRAAGDLPGILRARQRHRPRHRLVPVDLGEARDLLEALRQLAARLDAWARAHAATATGREGAATTRGRDILSYIDLQKGAGLTLTGLARHLGLSVSRTSHEVRRCTGRSFRDLVAEARLASALDLVLHTDLPIQTIALRCGFTDPSPFHRAFRRRFGGTPRRLREHGLGP